MTSKPNWKNVAAFVLYPPVGMVMAVCCLVLIVLLWPICLFADFSKKD